MKKILFAFVVLFNLSHAQTNVPVEPSDAPWINYIQKSEQHFGADLLKINSFTGVGTINIPFYKYSIEGLNLGVSINYATKGILVDKIPSCFGIGWELYAGGYIERQKKGNLNDEFNVATTYSGAHQTVTGFWATTPSTLSENGDDEPDLFVASFGGKTIKFMFSKTGNLITIPQNFNNYTIKRFINGVSADPQTVVSNGDLSFQITDDQGNNFWFDKKKYYTLTGVNFLPTGTTISPVTIYCISEWKLTKVQTGEGRTIYYTYDFDDNYDGTYAYGANEYTYYSQSVDEKSPNVFTMYPRVEEKNYYNYHLSKVSYPNNIDVIFRYASSTNGINSIDVTERNVAPSAVPQKLTYIINRETWDCAGPTEVIDASYYTAHPTVVSAADAVFGTFPVGTQLLARNALKSIDIIGTNGVDTRNYYTFSYSRVPLPQRVYGGQDIYGYSNGKLPADNSSVGLSTPVYVPQNTFGPYSIGMDRSISTDVNVVSAGALLGITNGAGGTITWQYILNPLNVGGLVISSVNYYDGYSHDNDINKAYTYADGETFVSEGNAIYAFKERDCRVQQICLNSGNLLNTFLNGTNYGFKTVTEKSSDNSSHQVNKIKYYYSGLFPTPSVTGISDNTLSNGLSFGTPPYANKQYLSDWGIGLLVTKENYDYNDQKTKSEEYTYDVTVNKITGSDFTGKLRYHINSCPTDFGAVNIVEDDYQPFTGYTRLNGKKTKEWYTSSNFIENDEVLGYSEDQRLLNRTYYNNIGNTFYEYYLYNTDWAIPGAPDPGAAVNSMTANNIKKLLAIYKYKNLSTNPATAHENDYTNYLYDLTAEGWINIGTTSAIYRPKYIYSSLTPSSPVPYLSSGGNIFYVDMADLSVGNSVPYAKLQSLVSKFDDVGNPIEIRTNGVGNIYKSKIVDGEAGTVLAEADNAQYDEIAYCGFESDYPWPTINRFMTGNWNFNPFGITASHHLFGRCSFHCSIAASTKLNTNGSLQIGKQYTVSFWCLGTGSEPVFVNDGGGTTVWTPAVATYKVWTTGEVWTLYKGTFTAAGAGIGMWGEGYIDEIKVYPSDCLMQTHNYLPLAGKTADVDVNDNPTTYEYDPFGNLSVTRDQNGCILSKTKTVNQGY